MIHITLPDGSEREFLDRVTVADVSASIGAGLAKAALAGKVNGRLVDTSAVIEGDCALSIITAKDADGLEVIRHSTAHLLAYAVKSLFPDAQVTIGPVIENGFFYDFSYKRSFTLDDLAMIEKKMTDLAQKMSLSFDVFCQEMKRCLTLRVLASITKPKLFPVFQLEKMYRSIKKVGLRTFAVAHMSQALGN